ncbi:Vacuolar protein sorting-associated protein 53 [Stygiomarasmius scandens]|uniref:Vacuolar protein sorting-associated protein 53 n=1 Tax=Marasmiellus scandens TaxID=2682957 RepID=A0ABR1K7I7_9AGAR
MSVDLPHEVVLAIQRVFDQQSDDPLDSLSSDFNAVDILNSFFPDEASLAHIEAVQAKLAEDQRAIQNEIDILREQLKRNQDPDRMQMIQEMISELLGQMSRIREKATESEAVVRSITKDIQVLDLAKKNLILSMTTLKRLQMLVNALTQLEDQVKQRNYSEISQTLAAVKQISASFKSYTSIPRVMQVWRRIQEIQNELRTFIEADFDKFYLQDPSKPIKPAVIADACLVVDVLGSDLRSQLVERYVALELKEYRRIFRTSDEAGHLDNISRRFAWFRRLLQTHEMEQGRVFPAEWKVSWHLLAKFAEITRDDITTLLSTAGSSLTVKTLLDNLQIVIEFESSMAKKWVTPFHEMLAATVGPNSRPPKPITFSFEPHMGVFVDAHDKALSDMLAPHRRNKGAKTTPRPSLDANAGSASVEDDGNSSPIIVLPSSTELFYFYGQSLEQCAKLSTGQPLFDLCSVHKKWLKIYAEDVLTASLKRPIGVPAPRKSMESRFDVGDLKQASIVINTADYCQTTAAELEEKIREKINDEFKEKVSLQNECELFVSTISSAIVIQLRELESACEPAFSTMANSMWSTLSQVSGPSPYTADLVRAAEQVIEVIKPTVEQKKYLRNFFDKACSLLIAKFTNALVKSRPLGEVGAEQLLIDLQTIKAFLSKMPGDLVTTNYTRNMGKSTGRLESLLKVIVTPVDPPEGFILNYTLLIGDASFSNFQKILDLKGTPKAEQNHLLDSFVTITSTKDDLESTSFLSSLDMDPPAQGHLGGMVSPTASASVAESIFAGLASPPMSGPPTGSSIADGSRGEQRREVFSDFRRFVSFGLRRDTQGPS